MQEYQLVQWNEPMNVNNCLESLNDSDNVNSCVLGGMYGGHIDGRNARGIAGSAEGCLGWLRRRGELLAACARSIPTHAHAAQQANVHSAPNK